MKSKDFMKRTGYRFETVKCVPAIIDGTGGY